MKRIPSLLLLIALTMVGCAPLMEGPGSGFGKVDFSDFDQYAEHRFEIDYEAEAAALSLDKMPNVVQLRFNVPEHVQILAVKLEERDNINLSRYLLTGKKESDYLFEQSSHELHINFRLPLIYFVDGKLTYHLTIHQYDDRLRGSPRPLVKTIVFNWKPRLLKEPSGYSYSLLTDLTAKELRPYLPRLRQEYALTNVERLDRDYLVRVNKLIER